MSVAYELVFKDGRKVATTGSCFGGTSRPQFGFLSFTDNNRPSETHGVLNFNVDRSISYIWKHDGYPANVAEARIPEPGTSSYSSMSRETRALALRNFFKEAKLMLEDMPWLKRVVILHPISNIIRVKLKDVPADEVMSALFLFRNLANYDSYAATYLAHRRAGYRPRFCAILAHFFYQSSNAFGAVSYSVLSLGEYNWFNPTTFGLRGFIQLMSADESTPFDFIQQPWTVQKGYRRDSYYSGEGPNYLEFEERFYYNDPNNREWDFNERRLLSRYQHTAPQRVPATRKLTDGLCFPNDEPICEFQYRHPRRGLMFHKTNPADPVTCLSNLTFNQMDEIVSSMVQVCTDRGIRVTE